MNQLITSIRKTYGSFLTSNDNPNGLDRETCIINFHYSDQSPNNTVTTEQTRTTVSTHQSCTSPNSPANSAISIKDKWNFPLSLFLIVFLAGFAAYVYSLVLPEGRSDVSEGLSLSASRELRDVGLDAYLWKKTAKSSEDIGNGWTKHTFDPQNRPTNLRGGENGDRRMAGPICISGTPYSVFSRRGSDPSRLLIFFQGGGACWSNFYHCTVDIDGQEPSFWSSQGGVWDDNNPSNPFRTYNIVYMPYCDGSCWVGDKDVKDFAFPARDKTGGWRYHRGLQNQSAGLNVAKTLFPDVGKITLAGSSAGGIGVSTFAPFLVRFLFGNTIELTVFNDAGPIMFNPSQEDVYLLTQYEWGYKKFIVPSCQRISYFGQFFTWAGIGNEDDAPHNCHTIDLIRWRLDNDSTVRDAFYETDGDTTNRFFLGLLTKQPNDEAIFRELLVNEIGTAVSAHVDRYRRFIVSGDQSHTILQTNHFYEQRVNGVLLTEWTEHFLSFSPLWKDIVGTQ